jgi:integrase/recombinase XerD
MKKIKMTRGATLTFEECCNKYLENCRQRNLREGIINHYKQSYTQFYKFFDRNMLVSKITQKKYNDYILFCEVTLTMMLNTREQSHLYKVTR